MAESNNPMPDMGDRNTEQLLARAYRPEAPDAGFAQRVKDAMVGARSRTDAPPHRPPHPFPMWIKPVGLGVAAMAVVTIGLIGLLKQAPDRPGTTSVVRNGDSVWINGIEYRAADTSPIAIREFNGMRPRQTDAKPAAEKATVGSRIATGAGQRRRLTLEDGSILYVNQNTTVNIEAHRRVNLAAGEVYVEVSPREKSATISDPTFLVKTPTRQVAALGTHFAVDVDGGGTSVMVTQGKVNVGGVSVESGQELPAERDPDAGRGLTNAPRSSVVLDWIQDLVKAAETPLVPASEYGGGALVAVDPNGQDAKLTLRIFNIDVYIEDGFARTTIDQTYFNHLYSRLEGTFYFPLPADASLSRLAMYVDGQLMEGGMCEREQAREVYENIVNQRRDPALLEWVDGTTFKMRVFPLEGRQEKRVLLSYTQKLDTLYGKTQYRFPAGHSMAMVGDWNFHAHIKNGAGTNWASESHALTGKTEGRDLDLNMSDNNMTPNRDVTFNLGDVSTEKKSAGTRFSTATYDGQRYLMLRHVPALAGDQSRQRRDWVFLFESSGARDPVVARGQIEVVKTMLENAEHNDTFSIITAGTRPHALGNAAQLATPENIRTAIQALEQTHLIGALDLGRALDATAPLVEAAKNPYLVHVGSGNSILGERAADKLVSRVPARAKYVGVGVGKNWSRQFMKAAASRTGGYFTQINPDESVTWRSFDLMATLNTPRLLNVHIDDAATERGGPGWQFLTFADSLGQGEELCAMTRMPAGDTLPSNVVVSGMLDGKPYRENLRVSAQGDEAGYLPRMWAKLEVDRLLDDGAEKNKPAVVALSKSMYVMSPYTSLLVLENDAMYEQFKVDRGRKDHWAMYPAPARIPVVYEPETGRVAQNAPTATQTNGQKRTPEQMLATVLVRVPVPVVYWPNQQTYYAGNTVNVWQYYSAAYQNMINQGWIENGALGWSFDGIQHGIQTNTELEFLTKRSQVLESQRQQGQGLALNALRDTEWAAARLPMPITAIPSTQAAAARGAGARGGRGRGNVGPAPTVPGLTLPNLKPQAILGLDYSQREGLASSSAFGIRNSGQGYRSSQNKFGLDVGGGFADGINFSGGLLKQGSGILTLSDRFATDHRTVLLRGVEEDQKRARFDGDIAAVDMLSRLGVNFGYNRSLVYQRPSYNNNWRFFGDLLQFAPGMNTSTADINAILDAEAQNTPITSGRIDDAARRVIDRARSTTWMTATIDQANSNGTFDVTFDGQGRYRYMRTVGEKLGETVINDGTTLLHLYPELGVGARRTMSRFHQDIRAMIPWLLPTADDLARGADVTVVDGKVRITAIGAADQKDDKGAAVPYVTIELAFAPGGRLEQRRYIEMPTGKTLLRETYSAEGVVKAFDEKGAELTKAALDLQIRPATAPALTEDTSTLVVMPLPYREYSHVTASGALSNNNPASWTQDEALAVLGTQFSSGSEMMRIIAQRFLTRGDRRIGFYTLLLASQYYINVDQEYAYENQRVRFNAMIDHPNSTLARFFNDQQRVLQNSQNAVDISTGDIAANAFVPRMAAIRDSIMRILRGETRPQETVAIVAKARQCADPYMAWALLSVAINYGGYTNETNAAMADIFKSLSIEPGLAWYARYEHARSLYSRADTPGRQESKKLFREMYTELLDAGVIPLIDGSFREAFRGSGTDDYNDFMRQVAATIREKMGRPAAVYHAWQMYQIGEQMLAEDLLTLALLDAPADQRLGANIAAIDYLYSTGQHPRAAQIIEPLLADPAWKDSPVLWRIAATIAFNRGLLAQGLEYQEKSMDLEYAAMPEIINLQNVRNDYSVAMRQYLQLANAMATLRQDPPADLIARVIRTADRWRAMDPDKTAPCQAAAQIFTALKVPDLAWDYLTTPLAEKSNEAQPWVNMANLLKQQGEFALADKAYATAFDVEPTNAQVLWDRATLLQQTQRVEEARKLFEKLADGNWETRFNGLKSQAQRYLQR